MADKLQLVKPTEQELNKGWIWIMQIIFSVIITYAFWELVKMLPGYPDNNLTAILSDKP